MYDYDRSAASGYWEQQKIRQAGGQVSEQAPQAELTVGGAFMDIATAPLKGLFDAGQSMANLAVSVTNMFSGTDFEKFDFADDMFDKRTTVVGEFVSIGSQFLIPFGAVGKAAKAVTSGVKLMGLHHRSSQTVKLAKALELGSAKHLARYQKAYETGNITRMQLAKAQALSVARSTTAGAAVDFAAFEMNEKRMLDLAAQVPGLEDVLSGVTFDESDSEFEARAKNMVDGAVLGVIGDSLFAWWRGRKASKAAKAAGATDEQAGQAGAQAHREVMEQSRVTKEAELDKMADEAFDGPMELPASTVNRGEFGAGVWEADGAPVTNLGDLGAAAKRTVEEARASETPIEANKLNSLEEGVDYRVDADTGEVHLSVSPERQMDLMQEMADEDVAKAFGRLGDSADPEDVLRAIKEAYDRDLPMNPRAKGTDVPPDLSRKAANMEIRRGFLKSPKRALALTRALEISFNKQNFGATLDEDQLREGVMGLFDKFTHLSHSERGELAAGLAGMSKDKLREGLVSMQTYGAMSNHYANEMDSLVGRLLQHEGMPDKSELRQLADMFDAFGQFQTAYTEHKSIFGLGLSMPTEKLARFKDASYNAARDACGMKP